MERRPFNPARIKIAKPDIVAFFDENRQKVLTQAQISQVLDAHRRSWRLTKSTTLQAFVDFLIVSGKLRKVVLEFPRLRQTRYLWGEPSVYEIALSLRPSSYLTHYSAMFLHGLTEQIPKTVYVNQEQPARPQQNGLLEQSKIDFAFSQKVRTSRTVAKYKEFTVCLLNGKQTGQLGVIDMTGPQESLLRVTDLERTLIDIAVRPVYSGGVFEVLKAYRLAKEKVSINRLTALLQKLGYVYPYHQAIGYYLEKAGVYEKAQVDLLRKFPIRHNFYLAHRMVEKEYYEGWRLFVPKGF